MKKLVLSLILLFFTLSNVIAQVRTNLDLEPNTISLTPAFLSAELFTSVSNGKGFLFPTTDLTVFNFNAISPPFLGSNFASRFDGLLLYNTTTGVSLVGNDPVSPGFYYYYNPGPFTNPFSGLNDGHWIPFSDDKQALSFDENGILSLENGGNVDLTPLMGTDAQQMLISGDSLLLDNGGGVLLSEINTDNQTIDTELNGTSLSISIEDGNTETVDLSSLITGLDTVYSSNSSLIVISNGFSDTTIVDLGDLADTDDQTLSLSNYTLSLVDGGSVDLSSFLDNTDSQELSIDGDSLRLVDGGAVGLNTLGSDNQNLTLSNDTLYIANGNFIVLPSGTVDTDDQLLSLSNDTIYLVDGGFVKLPSQTVDTDDQTLSLSNYTLSLVDGGSVDLSSFLDNTDSQELSIDGDSLRLVDGGAVGLNTLGSDNQNLTLSNDTLYIANGNFIVLPSGTVDTDDQLLSLSNDTIYLVDGGFVKLPSQTVDTDDQTLSLSNYTLSLVDGGSVDLSSFLDNTDSQELSIDGDSLRLVDGGAVGLNTLGSDNQTINSDLSGTNLSISIDNGNTEIVDLSSLITGLDTVYSFNSSLIVISNGFNDTTIVNLEDLADTDDQTLSISNDTIFLVDGGFVKLPAQTVDTDNQTLSLENDSLRIEDGNSVALNDLGTDNQNIESLSLNNSTNVLTVGIEDGTSETVDLSSLQDGTGTDNQALSIDGDSLRIEDGNAVALNNLGTDNQNIESLALNNSTNVLTVGIEDGTSGTVDLSSLLDNTDDQALSIDGDSLRLEDGGAVALNSFELIDDDGDTQIQVEESADDDIIRFDAGGVELATFSSSQATFGNPQTIDNQVILTPANSSGFEAYNASNFSIYNMTSSHAGSILFNNAFEIVGASYHGVRDVAGTDWGLGYGFDNSYVFSSIRLRSRGDCCGARVGGGQIRIYNAGELVATSSIINSSGNGQWTAAYIPNVVGDEVRYILPDGVNTQGGGSVFNFTEFEISGSQSSTVDLTVNGNARITGQIFDSGNSAGTDGQVLSATASGTDWVTPNVTVNTDNQNISGSGLSGTNLTIGIEGGNNEVVNLSSLQDGTGTDNQNISGSGLSGTNLTIGIEGGNNQVVNLSSLQDGTGTDNQNISGSGLNGTNLTIGIEGGNNQVVNLSSLQDGTGTDNQNISGSGLSGTNLTIGIEGGNNEVVNLSSLQDGTGTDNQNISGSGLNGTNLTIGIEGGNNQVVNLSSLQDGDAWGVNGEDQTTSISRTGRVGIGSTPITRLTVGPVINGTSSAYDEDALVISTDRLPGSSTVLNDPIPLLQLIRAGTSGVNWPSRANFSLSRFAHAGVNANSRLDLQLASTNFDNQTNVMTWLSNGNVGVGATSPSEKLTVQSGNIFVNNDVIGVRQPNISSTGVVDLNTVQEDLILTRYHSSNHQGFGYVSSLIDFRTDNGPEQWTSAQVFALSDAGSGNYSGGLAFAINPGGADDPDGSGFRSRGGDPVVRMLIQANGDVGIGVLNPSQKLHVNGNARITGQIFDSGNNAGIAGQVLSATASGTDWVTPNVTVNTDNQNISGSGLNGTNLTIGIEGGNNQVVNLSSLQDGTGTDNQNISGSGLNGTNLTIGIEGGNNQVVNLSSLQDGDAWGVNGENLTSDIDRTGRVLIGATGTPTQRLHVAGNARITGQIFDSGNSAGTVGQVLSATASGIDWVTPAVTVNTDDQTLSIDGDSLRLEDGGAVALNSFELIDGDGDTQIQVEESADDDIIRFDAGGVELATFSSSDAIFGNPQTGVSQVILTPANSSGFEAYNASNFSIYNMTSVHAGSILFNNAFETAGASYHGVRDVAGTDWGLGYGFDNSYVFSSIRLRSRGDCCEARVGGGQIRIYNAGVLVATSSIINSTGADQWTAAYVPNVVGDEVRYILPNGVNTQQGDQTLNFTEFEISGFVASNNIDLTVNGNARITGQIFDSGNNAGTAGQVLSATANGTDWITPNATVNTDNQNISGSGLNGTNLTIGIEGGNNQVVNLSSLQDGTGTDNQNISGSGLNGTNLTIGIEGGNNQVVNLSSLQDGDAWGVSGENLTSDIDRTGRVLIGATGTPTQRLHVAGNARITGQIFDSGNSAGTAGQVLSATASGIDWVTPAVTVNTDDQTLSIDGDSLRLEDGGAVALNSFELIDDDGDTQIQVEESADDDIIRFDAGGVELATFSSSDVIFGNPQTGVSQVILTPANSSGFEAYNASNFSIYNMTSSHAGSILFNNAFETAGASYHGVRDVAGTDWGLGYGFDNSYVFSSIRLRSRGDCCEARVGGGQIRIYNAGELVATSSIINSPGAGQWTAVYIPNVVGDEVRYILPNGVNTQQGDQTLNFTEFEISGFVATNNIDLTVNGNARITGQIFDSGNSAGAAGQVLSATASGTDWVTVSPNTDTQDLSISGNTLSLTNGGSVTIPSGADGDAWGVSGENLTSDIDRTGRVLIGATGTPTQRLHVAGNARITGQIFDSGNSAGTAGQVLSATASGTDWVTVSPNTDTQDLSISGNTLSLTNGGSVTIPAGADGDAWGVNGENQTTSISRTGRVGIGSTPITRLTVGPVINGTSSAYDEDALVISTDRLPGSSTVLNDPIPLLQLIRAGTSGVNWPSRANFSLSRFAHAGVNANSRLDLQLASTNFDNQTNVMTWLSNGNVGVGATAPSQRLHVAGGARITSIPSTNGNASSDRIVTTDNSGNLRSVPASSFGSGGPSISHAGRISSSGGILGGSGGFTVTKIGTGDYRINFSSAMSNSNYVIQLTVANQGGSRNDAPIITYGNQGTGNFRVFIGDSDNGESDLFRFDTEFMFTVITF